MRPPPNTMMVAGLALWDARLRLQFPARDFEVVAVQDDTTGGGPGFDLTNVAVAEALVGTIDWLSLSPATSLPARQRCVARIAGVTPASRETPAPRRGWCLRQSLGAA